ncbi:MAG: uroporphyrinogen-III synthase [Helicobacter sp.]|nr:uroporphyrinogen-III synthase [Helicobacteraceae bacterium]MDY3113582.1 uroporphyrinogen-III synthase [Helicobacter sp.]
MRSIYYITKENPILNIELPQSVTILHLIKLETIFPQELESLFSKSKFLIFTSKNAVFSLNENLQLPQNKALLAQWNNKKNLVLGESCAKALESLGKKADFISKIAYGDAFAKELISYFKDSNNTNFTNSEILFIRAKKVASNLTDILRANNIKIQDVVLYENKARILKEKPEIKPDSIIFFSAPSHIRAFLKNYKWNPKNIAFCIGSSTKTAAISLLSDKTKILQATKPNIQTAFIEMLNL